MIVCGGMSSLAAKTTMHKESHQLRKSRVISQQRTSQRALSVRKQEIKLAKLEKTPNQTAELNHINFILNHVKYIKLKLNQTKQKSGLTRRKKANVKITLQKLQTSAQTKSNKAKMILRAYKKK